MFPQLNHAGTLYLLPLADGTLPSTVTRSKASLDGVQRITQPTEPIQPDFPRPALRWKSQVHFPHQRLISNRHHERGLSANLVCFSLFARDQRHLQLRESALWIIHESEGKSGKILDPSRRRVKDPSPSTRGVIYWIICWLFLLLFFSHALVFSEGLINW